MTENTIYFAFILISLGMFFITWEYVWKKYILLQSLYKLKHLYKEAKGEDYKQLIKKTYLVIPRMTLLSFFVYTKLSKYLYNNNNVSEYSKLDKNSEEFNYITEELLKIILMRMFLSSFLAVFFTIILIAILLIPLILLMVLDISLLVKCFNKIIKMISQLFSKLFVKNENYLSSIIKY